ncbi:GntR family transcriptional regulator [Roseomonas sp. OT10]|uniref:GntR family transcriptional regulator n=1 Tax=Roseomonas cutis TaxID=2897332 RepID=UPI001E3A5280|nr:GntR family transcriptional regulator [Roseomonas sp. OT10]UFN47504.1 GntR family transcriptional regulator [Roseomonas sp. OT10]
MDDTLAAPDSGTSQLEQVTALLRGHILSGAFEPGERLMEVPLAEMLGTSRTPIRLALSLLQAERLVVAGGPRRGFVVNSFSLEEVFEAIEARGALEGLAARHLAERGLSPADAASLRAGLEAGAALLAEAREDEARADDAWGRAWARNNAAFHAALVGAARNRAIAAALEPLNRIPLTAPTAVVLRTGDRAADLHRLRRAQDDHADILDAVATGQGSRAEALLREHALLNIRNKRRNFAEIKARKAAGDIPGLDLVEAAAAPPPRRGRR